MKKSVKKVLAGVVFLGVFGFNLYYSSPNIEGQSPITLNELQAVADGDGETNDTVFSYIAEEYDIIPYGIAAPSIFDRILTSMGLESISL